MNNYKKRLLLKLAKKFILPYFDKCDTGFYELNATAPDRVKGDVEKLVEIGAMVKIDDKCYSFRTADDFVKDYFDGYIIFPDFKTWFLDQLELKRLSNENQNASEILRSVKIFLGQYLEDIENDEYSMKIEIDTEDKRGGEVRYRNEIITKLFYKKGLIKDIQALISKIEKEKSLSKPAEKSEAKSEHKEEPKEDIKIKELEVQQKAISEFIGLAKIILNKL